MCLGLKGNKVKKPKQIPALPFTVSFIEGVLCILRFYVLKLQIILLFFLADEWIKFDDDKVSIVTPEDILRLSGGGDWHIAYVLLYGPRRIEVIEDEAEQ